MRFLFLLVLLSSIMSVMCTHAAGYKDQVSKEVQMEKDESKPDGYYFEMSKKEIDSFVKKVRTLKEGMTIEEVITILGEPDYNNAIQGKQIDSPVRGRILKYYLKVWEKDLVNELKDNLVRVVFDKDNKLIRYEIILR